MTRAGERKLPLGCVGVTREMHCRGTCPPGVQVQFHGELSLRGGRGEVSAPGHPLELRQAEGRSGKKRARTLRSVGLETRASPAAVALWRPLSTKLDIVSAADGKC